MPSPKMCSTTSASARDTLLPIAAIGQLLKSLSDIPQPNQEWDDTDYIHALGLARWQLMNMRHATFKVGPGAEVTVISKVAAKPWNLRHYRSSKDQTTPRW